MEYNNFLIYNTKLKSNTTSYNCVIMNSVAEMSPNLLLSLSSVSSKKFLSYLVSFLVSSVKLMKNYKKQKEKKKEKEIETDIEKLTTVLVLKSILRYKDTDDCILLH